MNQIAKSVHQKQQVFWVGKKTQQKTSDRKKLTEQEEEIITQALHLNKTLSEMGL